MQLLTIEEVLKAGYPRNAAIQIVKIENERRKSKMSTSTSPEVKKSEPLAPVEENHVFTGHPSEFDNRSESSESEDEKD